MVETVFVRIQREENILHCVFADNLDIDLEVAKHAVNERITFSQGISYPCLIDMRGIKSVSKEAREYMAVEGARYIKAGALLVESSLSKMMVNLFLTINKPAIPTKLFTDEQEAKKWLKQYS